MTFISIDLLYFTYGKILELPTFNKVGSVPPYPPAEDIGYTVSGIVEDKLLICGGKP